MAGLAENRVSDANCSAAAARRRRRRSRGVLAALRRSVEWGVEDSTPWLAGAQCSSGCVPAATMRLGGPLTWITMVFVTGESRVKLTIK